MLLYGDLLTYTVHFISFCSKKPPPKKRAKPPIASKPRLPMCRALYDYDATDTDELTFREGDLIEIVKKGNRNLIAK